MFLWVFTFILIRPLGTVLEVCLRVRPSDAIRVLGALVRMILDLWAAPPRCGYLGELGIFFVLLPRIFGCGGSFTRAFLLGRLVFLYFCRIAREGSILEFFWVRFVRYWSILYVRQTSIFVIWVSYVKGKKKTLGRKEVLNISLSLYKESRENP